MFIQVWSGHPGQVDFPSWPVPSHFHLPVRQEIDQASCVPTTQKSLKEQTKTCPGLASII